MGDKLPEGLQGSDAGMGAAHLLLKGDAVGGDDQTMVAFDKKTGGRKVTWAHPAFAGQMAHARNDKRVVCVSLAKA